MKNFAQLLASIIGLTVLIGFPVTAQNNRLENSLKGTPSPTTENVPVKQGEMPDSTTEAAPASGNLIEQVTTNEQFETLAQAIQAAGLEDALAAEGPYTVFAPTNEAFAALPPETLQQLLQPENQEILAQLLSYHVIPGTITSSQIESGEVETLAGEVVAIELSKDGTVMVNNATVTQADIPASNGVIHGVDQVILPPQTQAQLQAAPEVVSQN